MLLDSSPRATMTDRSASPLHGFVDVCALSDLVPGVGIAVVIAGEQIALFRSPTEDTVHAISNYDPFSHAFVLSRGIVGDRGGVLKVASPMYKQSFDLRTGQCLDDAAVRLPVYDTRVTGGRVFISAEATS